MRKSWIWVLAALLFLWPGTTWAGTERVAPGVTYREFVKDLGNVKARVYVLEADLRLADLEVQPVLAEDKLGARERTSDMAWRKQAAGAINAGYYHVQSGWPAGSVILNGSSMVASDMLRTSLAFTREGQFLTGYFQPVLGLLEGDGNVVSTGEIYHLLTGGPLLIDNGRAIPVRALVGFSTSTGRQPRSAVGVTADDRLLMVTVDGRQAGSAGMTYNELATLMLELGAVKAVNLDGGGSSTLWAAGQVKNRPSDGYERSVANALVVVSKIPVYLDSELLSWSLNPVMRGEELYVAVREVAGHLGMSLAWDEETREAVLMQGDRELRLQQGETEAFVDEMPVAMVKAPENLNGTIWAPLSSLADFAGYDYDWDIESMTAEMWGEPR